MKVLVIDADPQCNATQLMLDEDEVFNLYDNSKNFTIYSIIHPLSIGKGYSSQINPLHVEDYGIDLVPGDPRLALKEDLLSKDWQDAISGDIRGLRTSYLFSDFLDRCDAYDLVMFDMGPSLGSINRAVLLSCGFFVSPMSIDIFSLKAIENISVALVEWRRRLRHGLEQAEQELLEDLPSQDGFRIKFAGYVAQQYIQKTTQGEKRAVASYEKIMRRIPKTIRSNFVDKLQGSDLGLVYEIGTIPNLYSLVPMSQTAHKPIFALKAKDGVRGAHFNKVKDAGKIYSDVTANLLSNLDSLG